MTGIGLAPAAYLAIALTFRESGDPRAIVEWLWYWASHVPEMLVGIPPLAAAGTIFGAAWCWPWERRDRTLGRDRTLRTVNR